ncbi:MAG: hemagglutinin repeat-containing protein [Desulfobacterales bacterium]|nr:hemagglutinin repeat-containing protein [Desulfobacterales bacterium]
MNRSYRLILNIQTGSWVAIVETFHFCCQGIGRAVFRTVLVALIACGSGMAPAMAESPATTVVPAGGKTKAYISANGVPVVDIKTANAAGLSHNRYLRYDVETNGLVLNNGNSSQLERQSQLAGRVPANLNLGAEARVILNEVVSTRRSTLAGFTEVLGGKADVVVANPNGITCNGSGFLNTNRVTLTTGTSNIAADGSLKGFSVNRGDVQIGAGGANASAQEIFDIVARSVNLSGKINTPAGGSLNLTTGNNIWNYSGRNVSGAVTGSGTAPTYAVDSSALGGMYAGKIRILSTEAGVGVRMLGEVAASAEDFTLSSAGKIEIQSAVSAARDARLTSTSTSSSEDLFLNGAGAKVSAGRDLTLSAAGGQIKLSAGELYAANNLTLTGATLSDVSTSAQTRFAGVSNTLTTTGSAGIDGSVWGAGSALSGTFDSLSVGTNGATMYADSTLDLTAANDLSLATAAVRSAGDMTLAAGAGTLSTTAGTDQGIQTTAGNLSLTAGNGLTNAGTMTSDAGSVTARIDGAFVNSGTLHAKTTLDIADKTNGSSENVTNSGTLLADATLQLKGDDIVNTGEIQAVQGTHLDAATFANAGGAAKFIGSTQVGSGTTLNVSDSFSNESTLQSAGALNVTAGSMLVNSGGMFALRDGNGGSNGAVALQAGSIDNSGTIDGGGTFTATATATVGNSFDNSGNLQGGGAMALDAGNQFSNQGAGTVVGESSLSITSSRSAFTLDNAGLLQSTGLMTLGENGHLVTLDNAGTGGILGENQIAITGGALTNAGTMQAATGAVVTGSSFATSCGTSKFLVSTAAGVDGSLTLTGAFNNEGTLQSAGGLNVNSTGTLANSGTIKTTGTGDTLALTGTTLTNSGYIDSADLTTLTATTTSGTTLTNSGQVTSVDALSIVTGGNLVNTSTGNLMGDGAVSITSPSAGFTLINDGRIESGSTLSLGGAGHVAGLTNNSSGVLFAGTGLGIIGGSLNNQGKITATSGTAMSLSALTNGSTTNSSAVILGATTSGESSISVSNSLSNYGAIHSNAKLGITAGGISNKDTGGISSLTTLNLTATGAGSIDNYGALYAGTVMNLTADGGSIYNRAPTDTTSGGTIDSGGTLTTSSTNFTNNHAVVTTGNISIKTTNSFVNETTIEGTPITKTLGDPVNVANGNLTTNFAISTEGSVLSGMYAYLRENKFTRTEQLSGITLAGLNALPRAQIIANGAGSNLTINYGLIGLNKIAVLSAPTINIAGTGTFTNEDLTLYEYEYTRRWIVIEDYYIDGGAAAVHRVMWVRSDPNYSGYTAVGSDNDNYDTYNPGPGWSTPYTEALANAGGLLGNTTAVPGGTSGSGIFATTLNVTGGTFHNVGSPWPTDPDRAIAGGPGSEDVIERSGSGADTESGLPVGSAGVDLLGVPSTVVADSPLSFVGLNLTLPTNPNGYFVISQNPGSGYLVETNPLFAVGSTVVGSDYMADRYGYDPDTIIKRLGDANYEAYLVRQQLIAQTGSNIINGYANEADQMMRLMAQAIDEGNRAGFVYGQALTDDQIANLQEDIVWMVETTVAGQNVLAPVVYLAAGTRDAIMTGAVIAAANVTMTVDALTNTGGTISGSTSLDITSQGDITNTSGTIKGGEVGLTSTEGSIVNQTQVEGAGDGTTYTTTIGKTAGIEATGNLDMDAGKDISVTGADVTAGGDASLTAGGDITFDTIIDKTTGTTGSFSTDDSQISSETTTTTTEKNIGSTLQTGGNLSLQSGNDTTIAGSDVTTGGDLEVNAGGDFNVISRQDTTTTSSVETKSGMGVGGGVWGTEKTTTDSFTGTNVGSTVTVGGSATVMAEKEMTLQGSDVTIAGDADINAKEGIHILDGLDEQRTTTTTTTETTTILKTDNSGEASSDSASASQPDSTSAGDSAEASAAASGSSDIKLTETTTTTTTSASDTSVSSNFTVGGKLKATTEGTLTVQGSNVASGGEMELDAKNIEVLTGRNETSYSKTTTSTSIGLFNDGEASADADATFNDNNGNDNQINAAASAAADASGTSTMGVRMVDTEQTSYSLTNTASSIKSGGDLSLKVKETASTKEVSLETTATTNKTTTFKAGGDFNRTATDTITDQGTQVSAGGNITQAAQTITDIAVSDSTATTSSSSSEDIMVGVGAGASGGGEDLGGAGAGLRVRYDNSSEDTENTSSTAVTSSFTAGGNITSTSKDKTTLVGTELKAGGDVTLNAGSLDYQAAHNTTSSDTSSENINAAVDVDVVGTSGFNLEGGYATEDSSSKTSTAKTGGITAGGNLNINTAGDATLEGTQLEAGKDANLNIGGDLNFKSAVDTAESSSESLDAGGALGASKKSKTKKSGGKTNKNSSSGGNGKEVTKAGQKSLFNYNSSEDEGSSSTARVGSITAGSGDVNIKTGNDATFVGTKVQSENNISIESGGTVNRNEATSTVTGSSSSVDVGLKSINSVSKQALPKDKTVTTFKNTNEGTFNIDNTETNNSSTAETIFNSGGTTTINGQDAGN